jgi:UDP-N-acetylglucosamine 4,6-dehydratase
MKIFQDKTFLITGGTGSFAKDFILKLQKQAGPKKIIVFSRDEFKQWKMKQESPLFAKPNMRYFLGDVRDKERLFRALEGVDIVVHTAALKQVDTAEYNPSEYIKTNILGAQNLIECAIDRRVEKVIALSTDKAVNPINLYGATKLCADKLFVAGASLAGAKAPLFFVVRYGNVLGSRGSILERFGEMEGDVLPITDERMTRFWITLDCAAQFVLESLKLPLLGSEILVPKCPSMKVIEFAHALNKKIKITGIRPGEKLHECLIAPEMASQTLEFDHYYMNLPQIYQGAHVLEKRLEMYGGKRVEEHFSYRSDQNEWWITPQDDLVSSLKYLSLT